MTARPAPTPLAGRLPQPRTAQPVTTSWLADRPVVQPAPMFAPVTAGTPGAPSDPADDPRFRAQLAEALAAARVDGRAQGLAEVAPLRAKLAASIAALDDARRTGIDLAAAQIAELALLIAGEIIAHTPTLRGEALGSLVRGAVATLAGEGDLTIHLHPDDLDAVRAAPPAHPGGSLRLIDDAALAPGECIVESDYRVVDATLEARLAEVRAGVVELLERGEGDRE